MSSSCQVLLYRSCCAFVLYAYSLVDETSPSFWGKVRERGWFFVNHTEAATAERYGEWYLPLIDIVIQSHAVGFVGTKSSTFSLLGERRVQDWNGGIVREVSIRDNK